MRQIKLTDIIFDRCLIAAVSLKESGANPFGFAPPGCHIGSLLLLRAVAITAAELVDTSCGVHEFLLAGEEGVRRTGDLKLYEGILLAVNLDCLA